jgi:iron complex transport system ATP-binding protein
MPTVLNIENLIIGYNKSLSSPINLTVESGELIVLTGKNGSGKSTFLKHIGGIIKPIGGQVKINGKPVAQYSIVERAQLIALILNQRVEEPYIKVEEIVMMGRFAHRQKIENDQVVENAIQLMKLEPIRHQYLNQISDGEWQKTNIARALAQDTPLILLDEPSAFLDYPSKIDLFNDLKQIATQFNKIIVLSTHDINVCKNAGTRFWHLEDGVLHDNSELMAWQ